MALVTTFATTPLTLALFPPWYQKKLAAWKRGEIDWDGHHLASEDASSGDGSFSPEKGQDSDIRRLLVCLRLDSLPSLFTFVALLGGDQSGAPARIAHPTKNGKATSAETDQTLLPIGKRPLEVHGLRMLELSERLSSVMKEAEADELSTRDPVVNAFHTFGQLNNVAVSGEVQLVPEGAFPELISERATDRKSDMILLPWSENGNFSEVIMANMTETAPNAFGNSSYNHFVSNLLDRAPCNAAVFINNGFGAPARADPGPLSRVPTTLSLRSIPLHATAPLMDRSHHIFFPFLGGHDDRVALRFVLRLAKSPNVTATIIDLRSAGTNSNPVMDPDTETTAAKPRSRSTTSAARDSVSDPDRNFFTSMADSLPSELQSRVFFDSMDSAQPVQDALSKARIEVCQSPNNAGDLVIVGRNQGSSIPSHATGPEGEIRGTLGLLAEAIILGNVRASLLVIQAGRKDL